MKPGWVERERRLPLVVQVVSEPPLVAGWAVNISRTGLGLIASQAAGVAVPEEGARLMVGLRLPDTGEWLRAEVEVMWRDVAPSPEAAPPVEQPVELGVRFVELPAAERLRLERYLASYRVHVGVAGADAALQAALTSRLGEAVELHFAATEPDIDGLGQRGDLAALVFAGTVSAGALERAAERLDAGVPADLQPRIIAYGDVPPERLVLLFNRERLFRAVEPGKLDELERAVLAACRTFGVRNEQRRAGLALQRALARRQAKRRPAGGSTALGGQLIHESPAMAEVLAAVRRVAPHSFTVLLQGETGSGKEVLARVLHACSSRAGGPLVVQDCGALTETLLESELFGHVRGAFTGATRDHPGLFALADGGTVFLDEIENTTPGLQAKLLRVIETGEVRPVGGLRSQRVDVRLVAASNRDLRELARAGRFRDDLYWRLASFPIEVPPLRQRTADVVPLASHFLEACCKALGREPATLSPAAVRLLERHDWPGNVRELRNAIERAALLLDDAPALEPRHLPAALQAAPRRPAAGLKGDMSRLERQRIAEALERHGHVLRYAAQELGMNEITLGRKARRYELL